MKVGDLVIGKVQPANSFMRKAHLHNPAIVIEIFTQQISSIVEPRKWARLFHGTGNISISSLPVDTLEVLSG